MTGPEPEGLAPRRLRAWPTLLYSLTLLCIAVLAATGLGTFFFSSRPMTGWVLMLHCAVAPPFAIFIALLGLAWAHRSRFTHADRSARFDTLQKLLFWVMIGSAVVVIVSAVVPMTPLFGTHGQEVLYHTHQVSSLVLTIAVVLHAVRFFTRR